MPMNNKQVFASVGTRFPMDRLLRALENIASKHDHWIVQAQIGPSSYSCTRIKTQSQMTATEFEYHAKTCDVFVSHAGMGNILLAAKLAKPIVIMPRLPELNEHINDHQLGTVKAMLTKPFIRIANTESELEQAMLSTLKDRPITLESIDLRNREKFIEKLRNFIVDA